MADLKALVAAVKDEDSLAALLREGLGWPVALEFAFQEVPDVAQGVKSNIAKVSRLIPASLEDEHLIVLAEFDGPYVRRDLRELLTSLRRHMRTTGEFEGHTGFGDTIFIVSSPQTPPLPDASAQGGGRGGEYGDVRFVLFEEQDGRQPRIRSFGWNAREIGRTLITHNLDGLRWDRRDKWLEAWNVEKLTKQFFTEISGLFFDTIDAVSGRIPDENEQRLFVQTLFNRLLFLRFVEEKGWLKFPLSPVNGGERGSGGEGSGYLRALWQAGKGDKNPFWPTRLNALFQAVNHPTSNKIDAVAKPLIGDVEYLNGGLFEDDPRFVDPELKIPERIFDNLLGPQGLFYKYNFTVEESSPLDVQVAVDPEILGKIFEQLTLSGKRHDTGSYYTPREIVQFMCREALVGYLSSPPLAEDARASGGGGVGGGENENPLAPPGERGQGVRGPGLPEDKARKLVYDHDDTELTNQEGNFAFNALKAIKVVDPACGSGAYLLGMLQELYALFAILRRDDRKFSDDPAKEAHERKLWIIENNIYGVDLQAFASNTAMLRLWLTLLVEDSGKTPQPLPNLEYKIETGDSLFGSDPSQPIDWSKQKRGAQAGLDVWDKDSAIRELRDLRAQYQDSHGKLKDDRKKDLEAKLAELREKVTGSPTKDPAKFDWRVEFFDMFLGDRQNPLSPMNDGGRGQGVRGPGFDIVLANPPYLSTKHGFGHGYERRFIDLYETATGQYDAYALFLERALQLLGATGQYAYIVPKPILVNSNMMPVRRLLLRHRLVAIALPGRVFDAIVESVVLAGTKGVRPTGADLVATPDANYFRSPHCSLPTRPLSMILVPSGVWNPVTDTRWKAQFLDRPRLSTLLAITRGVEAGKRDSSIQYRPSKATRPLLRGEDLQRFCISPQNIHIYPGPDISKFKPPALYDPPKLVIRRVANQVVAAIDESNAYALNTIYVARLNPGANATLLYCCGLLNSAVVGELFAWLYINDDELFPYIRKEQLDFLPIPRASDADRAAIEALVQQILDLKAANPAADVSEYEAEIDARVEFLYFHQDEAPTYDEWLANQEAEKETVVEDVRKLLAIGHETTEFECKSSFSWDVRKGEQADWLKDEVHTAICAMLNAKGGDLLIGVDDDMNVLGLAPDLERYGNKDKLIQAIEGPLGKTLTPNPIGLVDIKPLEIDGKTIIRVIVKADNGERYRFKDQIYVRRNSKSKPALASDEAASWWPKRQRGEV